MSTVQIEKKETPYSTMWIRKARSSLIKVFGGKCFDCKKKLKRGNCQFAHLKPTDLYGRGRGSWQRLVDIMKHPSFYGLFCLTCHIKYDNEQKEKIK